MVFRKASLSAVSSPANETKMFRPSLVVLIRTSSSLSSSGIEIAPGVSLLSLLNFLNEALEVFFVVVPDKGSRGKTKKAK